MKKKAFTLTSVVMEKDRDTTKCYDSIYQTSYRTNADILTCESKCQKEGKESNSQLP